MGREAEKHLEETSTVHYLFIFSILQPRQTSLPLWPPIESSIELRLVVGYIKRSCGNGDSPPCNVHVSTWYIIYSTGPHACDPAANSCRQGQIIWSNISFCRSQYYQPCTRIRDSPPMALCNTTIWWLDVCDVVGRCV